MVLIQSRHEGHARKGGGGGGSGASGGAGNGVSGGAGSGTSGGASGCKNIVFFKPKLILKYYIKNRSNFADISNNIISLSFDLKLLFCLFFAKNL